LRRRCGWWQERFVVVCIIASFASACEWVGVGRPGAATTLTRWFVSHTYQHWGDIVSLGIACVCHAHADAEEFVCFWHFTENRHRAMWSGGACAQVHILKLHFHHLNVICFGRSDPTTSWERCFETDGWGRSVERSAKFVVLTVCVCWGVVWLCVCLFMS
jgi:hypothetical protein